MKGLGTISELINRIYLIGMMGVGKSTIGLMLAEKLSYDFVDTDARIEGHGMTIAEIFETKGEEDFRKLESDVLLDISSLHQVVIATGGGLPCHNENLSTMLDNGIVIYLKVSVETILPRLNTDGHRPKLGNDAAHVPDILQSMLLHRKSCYERAHITIDANAEDPRMILESIMNQLR